jgi:transcriptional regulator with XRE-family HTH domain
MLGRPIVVRFVSNLAPGASGIAARLKLARSHAKLTIRALASAAGVASSAITDTEIGNRIPRADTIEKIARALGVSACWLAYGEGTSPRWAGEDNQHPHPSVAKK